MKGVVSKSTGSWYKVLINGQEVDARLRGKIRQLDLKSTNPVTVGDVVELEKEGEEYLIKGIDDRKNCIVRKSNKLSKQHQLIAANIDLALLLITPDHPFTPMGFIDRYLVTAAAYHIPVLILLNKKDLETKKAMMNRENLYFIYLSLKYDIDQISCFDPEDIERVRKLIQGKTCLISGNSGVGKSTLVNALGTDIHQEVGKISSSYKKGQHTTTFAQMFVLDKETYIIDTPGIKDFGLVYLEKHMLSHYFPEMEKVLHKCRFNNCLHVEEPDCAVRESFDNGEIYESRYLNYLGMLDELDGLGQTMKKLRDLLVSLCLVLSLPLAHSVTPMEFYELSIKSLDDDSLIEFSSFQGKKVLLVNVASKCGYTHQYEDLQKLYEAYKDELVVIGFPCNQFGRQEPGSAEEIQIILQHDLWCELPNDSENRRQRGGPTSRLPMADSKGHTTAWMTFKCVGISTSSWWMRTESCWLILDLQ